MRFEVKGEQVFATTGGREHVAGREWILFLHGAGQSHLTWSQQTRAFAYDDYNILAVDLPGHGTSTGKPLGSVREMAAWVINVMDVLGIEEAHFVNHSMGGLICLDLGAHYRERVKSIVFIATAMTIAVGDKMIFWAQNEPRKSIDMMTSLGHSSFGHHHDTPVPGTSLIGFGVQVMEYNDLPALPADLIACAQYKDGEAAAIKIECACLNIISSRDRMVAARFGRLLHERLENSILQEIGNGGHMLPAERPREINQMMRAFYSDQ